ncbi:type II toxin-antitoxin system RelB/DinJ family antitoxin [Acinetobacter sp. MB5]|uniref:type II toxin-antitoxin system RelB/DinJ family antitoxin n=1 Tax=Acinetobacter sp. MB5 TaxID=2069438 RepID=UPI000DD05892|nr:type II toxin-antitoxin system RelB/DinJ family antitoxin [Acinetobacter sp. MB5]
MRKTEVYQIRLDSQEKKQAFAVFKQLGITPAQAVRLFFKQVVLTKSIPFSIENPNIDLEHLIKLKKFQLSTSTPVLEPDTEHQDIFDELDAILKENPQN